jgi:uncharacterized protein (TIRG00374 family)
MANYVFAYSGGKGVAADETERNAQYAKWASGSNNSVRPSSTAAPRWGPRRRLVQAARSATAARRSGRASAQLPPDTSSVRLSTELTPRSCFGCEHGRIEGPSPIPDSRPPRSLRPWSGRGSRRVVLLAVTGVSLYLVFPSLVSVFGSWRSLTHLDWYWVALALAAESASFASLWQLDRIALRTKSWFVIACMQLSGNAVGHIVPGGGATAAAFEVGMLRRAHVHVGRAIAALTASTALQIATTLALPLLALPAIFAGAPINPSLTASLYLGIAALLLLLTAGAISFATDWPLTLAGRAIRSALHPIVAWRPRFDALPERLLEQRNFIRATLGRRWLAALLAATGNAGFDYVALLCALRAVGAQPRPSLVLLAYVAASFLGLIPFTPGGLGFVEAGLVATLALAGVSPAHALVATLLYRLVAFWFPIPVGGAAYVAFRRRYPDPTQA